jgi:hypothetical protein
MAKTFKAIILDHLKETNLTAKQKTLLKKKIPSPGQLQEELEGIDREFEKLYVSKHYGRITARTKNIIIEGTDLGPFEIRLWLRPLYDPHNKPKLLWCARYSIRALKPQLPIVLQLAKKTKSWSNLHATHPHISTGGNLCAGTAGNKAILQASSTFRVADVFFILNSILRGYNPSTSYRTIEGWKTEVCRLCGVTRKIESLYMCMECGRISCKRHAAMICNEKGCKSAVCTYCKAGSPRHRTSCKVHRKAIGQNTYRKPKSKKTTKEKKDKFNGVRGWSL